MGYDKEKDVYIGYIYLIENTVNHKKYIGQTITTVEERWKSHIYASRCKKPKQVIGRAMKKYGDEKFSIKALLSIHCKTSELLREDLDEFESIMIRKYESGIDKNGYNVETGGTKGQTFFDPIIAYNLNGEIIGMFDSLRLAAEYYATNLSVIKKVCRGKMYNFKNQIIFRFKEDSFDKYPLVNPNKHFDINTNINSEYNCNDYSHVSVDVYKYETLEKIGTYETLSDCGRDLNICPTVIGSVCRGKTKRACGYIFRYKDDPLDKYQYVPKFDASRKPINKYSLDGVFIETFETLADAVRSVKGRSVTNVWGCCRHKRNKAYGYKWFLAYDESQPDKSKIIPLSN